MLLSLLLIATLDAQTPPPRPFTPPPAPQAAVAPPTHNEAAALADAGDLDASLRAFQRIAATNPEDRDARLWIANIQMALHHPDRAEPVYRSLLLEDPMNLQARVGVANTLNAREEYKDALDMLDPAENEAPQNPSVLVAVGEAHYGLGHIQESITYFERVVAIAPTPAHRRLLENARLRYNHRIEGSGLLEQFNGNVEDTRGVDVGLNLRLGTSLRVSGRGQRQEKFDIRDTRGGAGVEWRFNRSTSLQGDFMAGPDSRVLAQYEGYGQLNYVRGPAEWRFGYRHLDFFGARASIVGPAVRWQATNRLFLDLSYALVLSQFAALAYDRSPALSVRAGYDLFRRVSVFGGYARGIENFHMVSIDRLGQFDANTLSAGAAVHFPSLTTIQGNYEYQDRPSALTMSRFTISFGQRF